MKKVYLHGSFMNDNFGDYLLFKVVGDWIYEANKKNVVISTNTSQTYDNIAKFERYNKKEVIKESDMIILGGGGYLGEPNSNRLKWALNFTKNHSTQFLRIIKSKKPYIIVGAGAGPQKYFFTRWVTKKICNNAKFISVRDDESRDFLYSIGVNKDIKVIPDIVMSLTDKELDLVDSLDNINLNNDSKKNVVIHLTSRVSVKNKILVEDIKRYAENKDVKFIISSDQGREALKQRNKFWVEQLIGKDVEVYDYKSPKELLKIISNSDMIITDKLHVGIVGTRMYKKVVSVAGHSKIERFYKQMGRKETSKRTSSINSGEIYSFLCDESIMDNEQVKIMSKLAKENKELVIDFLNQF